MNIQQANQLNVSYVHRFRVVWLVRSPAAPKKRGFLSLRVKSVCCQGGSPSNYQFECGSLPILSIINDETHQDTLFSMDSGSLRLDSLGRCLSGVAR